MSRVPGDKQNANYRACKICNIFTFSGSLKMHAFGSLFLFVLFCSLLNLVFVKHLLNVCLTKLLSPRLWLFLPLSVESMFERGLVVGLSEAPVVEIK